MAIETDTSDTPSTADQAAENQLIRRLFSEGPKSLVAGLLVAATAVVALRDNESSFWLSLWFVLQSGITLARLLLIFLWRRKTRESRVR